MARNCLSVFKKQEIFREARNSGNVCGTARKHNMQPNQIREWRTTEQKLIERKIKIKKFGQCTEDLVHTIHIEKNWWVLGS